MGKPAHPGQPPGVVFWFRQSPVADRQPAKSGRVTFQHPLAVAAGNEPASSLISKGRLQYSANLPRIRDTEEPAGPVDWKVALVMRPDSMSRR